MSVSSFGRRITFGFGLLSSVSLSGLAQAQSVSLPLPPVRSTVDERGVDLTSGNVAVSETELSIGHPGNSGLTYRRYWAGQNGWRHDYMISAVADTVDHVMVAIAGDSYGFTIDSNRVWISDEGDGSQLSETPTSYTFTANDGTTYYLDKTIVSSGASYYGPATAVATLITTPTGKKTYLTYKADSYIIDPIYYPISVATVRLQSVTTSEGYQLKYSYASNYAYDPDAWYRITQVTAINNAVDYCDPSGDSCSGLTQAWPSVNYSVTASGSNKVEAATDPAGRTRSYTTDPNGRLVAFRRPSSAIDNTTFSYDANGRVSAVSITGVGSWTYQFSLSGTTLSANVYTPSISTPRQYTSRTTDRFLLTDRDETGQLTRYTPDIYGRLLIVTRPE